MSLLASSTQTVSTPSIAYEALSPILIVLGAALLGVLIEAFVPRRERFNVQLAVTMGGLIAALCMVATLHGSSLTTPSPRGTDSAFAGAVAIDNAGLFIQGTVLVLAIVATLLMAERSVDVGSPIVAAAGVVVGSADDRRLSRTDRVQTEIFPLMLFAIAGMLIFPVSNNLILMFVALEVLSLPL